MKTDLSQHLIDAWLQMSGWEIIAVILAIAYLVLAVRQNSLCWYCALASTAIYTVIFWEVQLLMESALNVYYMLMAIYGWWHWRRGEQKPALPVQRWHWRRHALIITGITFITLTSGVLLSRHTEAAWPFVDSFTTWASVITTYMVARKVLENWYYWMVINSTSMIIFIERELYLTALLLMTYLIISIFGYIAWRRDYRAMQYA